MQPDRTIPFSNIILRCDRWEPKSARLPEGYTIRPYEPGDEDAWAELECAVGDFDSAEEARRYFVDTYLTASEAKERCLFAVDPQGRAVGSCIAWQDDRMGKPVASLHWLVVEEAHRRMGLGRALCHAVMNLFAARDGMSVYIHTQPWSWPALLLYLDLGFRWQKTDVFSRYENQYETSMTTLTKVLGKETADFLRCRSDP